MAAWGRGFSFSRFLGCRAFTSVQLLGLGSGGLGAWGWGVIQPEEEAWVVRETQLQAGPL